MSQRKFILTIYFWGVDNNAIWIGGFTQTKDGQEIFYWVDGSRLQEAGYTNWHRRRGNGWYRQPDNGAQHCLRLGYIPIYNGQWFDAGCSSTTASYLCEKSDITRRSTISNVARQSTTIAVRGKMGIRVSLTLHDCYVFSIRYTGILRIWLDRVFFYIHVYCLTLIRTCLYYSFSTLINNRMKSRI